MSVFENIIDNKDKRSITFNSFTWSQSAINNFQIVTELSAALSLSITDFSDF